MNKTQHFLVEHHVKYTIKCMGYELNRYATGFGGREMEDGALLNESRFLIECQKCGVNA